MTGVTPLIPTELQAVQNELLDSSSLRGVAGVNGDAAGAGDGENAGADAGFSGVETTAWVVAGTGLGSDVSDTGGMAAGPAFSGAGAGVAASGFFLAFGFFTAVFTAFGFFAFGAALFAVAAVFFAGFALPVVAFFAGFAFAVDFFAVFFAGVFFAAGLALLEAALCAFIAISAAKAALAIIASSKIFVPFVVENRACIAGIERIAGGSLRPAIFFGTGFAFAISLLLAGPGQGPGRGSLSQIQPAIESICGPLALHSAWNFLLDFIPMRR